MKQTVCIALAREYRWNRPPSRSCAPGTRLWGVGLQRHSATVAP
jgi:hypothetical protein